MTDFHIIIPARFASTRLPGKALLDMGGKPMIQRVYERALQCNATTVTIATDDERIEATAKAFGASVCMTKVSHQCGTERLAEAVQYLNIPDKAIVVNIQGDEPFIPSEAVSKVVIAMQQNPDAAMTTLCTPIKNIREVFDPHLPKVIFDKSGYALYFSRAPIPFNRAEYSLAQYPYYRHIGLYAYRASTLQRFTEWGISPLEAIESLEQLRILWNGEKIHVSVISETPPPGIDTEADLLHARALFETSV